MPPRAPLPANCRGVVWEILGATTVKVEIPHLNIRGSHSITATVAEGWWSPNEVTAVADLHSHGIGNPLAVGDAVVVAFLDGYIEKATVTGRLP